LFLEQKFHVLIVPERLNLIQKIDRYRHVDVQTDKTEVVSSMV